MSENAIIHFSDFMNFGVCKAWPPQSWGPGVGSSLVPNILLCVCNWKRGYCAVVEWTNEVRQKVCGRPRRPLMISLKSIPTTRRTLRTTSRWISIKNFEIEIWYGPYFFVYQLNPGPFNILLSYLIVLFFGSGFHYPNYLEMKKNLFQISGF